MAGKLLMIAPLLIGLGLGLACAAAWHLQGIEGQQAAEVTMPALSRPMQMPKVPFQPIQHTKPRNFMQPAQASKEPVFDMVIPDKQGKPVDVEIPLTRRNMMMAGIAGLAAAFPSVSRAEEATTLKQKICASNPTAKICLFGSATGTQKEQGEIGGPKKAGQ